MFFFGWKAPRVTCSFVIGESQGKTQRKSSSYLGQPIFFLAAARWLGSSKSGPKEAEKAKVHQKDL